MAHGALLRASQGLWVGIVTQAEFWAFDNGQFKSINGDEGGTWAPSSPIVIGGSGLQVTGNAVLTGDSITLGNNSADNLLVNATSLFYGPVYFNGAVDFDDDVTISAGDEAQINRDVAFNEDVQIDKLLTVNGTTVVASSSTESGINITLGKAAGADALEVNATMDMNGSMDISGALAVHSNLTVDAGPSSFAGSLSIAGPVTLATGASIRKRWLVFTTDQSVACTSYDWVEQDSTVVAARTVNLLAAGAANGNVIRVYNRSQTFICYVQNNGVSIDDVRYAFGSGDHAWVDYVYDNTAGGWRRLSSYGSTSPT
jgi:hypothetical protein